MLFSYSRITKEVTPNHYRIVIMKILKNIGSILLFILKLALKLFGFFFVFMFGFMLNSMRQIH